jgi:hypothetical protein
MRCPDLAIDFALVYRKKHSALEPAAIKLCYDLLDTVLLLVFANLFFFLVHLENEAEVPTVSILLR